MTTRPVNEVWADIKDWLLRNAPDQLTLFRPPASEAAIEAAETALSRQLPEDYKAFLRIHNGCSGYASFVEGCSPQPIERLPKLYTDSDVGDDGSHDHLVRYADREMQPAYYRADWVPIAEDPRGKGHLCIDYQPTEYGSPGQIVFVDLGDDERYCLASSFTGLLALYLEQLKDGTIKLR